MSDPVHFYMDDPTPAGKPIRLAYDGRRLKALSAVLLDWFDGRFSKQDHVKIRIGQPAEDEMNASAILHLFWKEE